MSTRGRLFLLALLFALTVRTAHARVGETEAELAARYGQPDHSMTKTGAGLTIRHYQHAGFRIMVYDMGGRSVSEFFAPEGSSNLSITEAAAIMKANAGARQWQALDATETNWRTTDGQIHAHVTTRGISISTTYYLEQTTAREKAAEAARLKGL